MWDACFPVLCVTITVVLTPRYWLLLCQMHSLANLPMASWHLPCPRHRRWKPLLGHLMTTPEAASMERVLLYHVLQSPIRLCKMSLLVIPGSLPIKHPILCLRVPRGC